MLFLFLNDILKLGVPIFIHFMKQRVNLRLIKL